MSANSYEKLDSFWRAFFARQEQAGVDFERALARVETVNTGRQSAHVDLSFCVQLPNLRELYVWHPDGSVVGKEAIAHIPRLRELVISPDHFSESDLPLIAASPTLAQLTINRLHLRDLTPLNESTKLKDLTLNGVTGLTAEGVAALSTVTTLRLTASEFSDLAPLAAMPRLRKLSLDNFNLDNLDFLAAPKLISFEFGSMAADESGLAVLAKKTQLTEFNYPVTDVSLLVNCTKLTSLRLNGAVHHDLGVIQHVPVRGVDVYFAPSETAANQLIEQARATWPELRSYGYREDWHKRSPRASTPRAGSEADAAAEPATAAEPAASNEPAASPTATSSLAAGAAPSAPEPSTAPAKPSLATRLGRLFGRDR